MYRHITKTTDIPVNTNLWIILTFDSISVPGDERSRTNPGHGYPGYTHYITNVQEYNSEKDWKQAISELINTKTAHIPLIATRPTVQIQTVVTVR